jgi:hypothetical protein
MQRKLRVKRSVFCDITPCSSLKVNRRFRITCRLHFQDRRISQARNHLEASSKQSWRWRRYVPLKRQLTFNGLHGVISQKIVLFITTAVRTLHPAKLSVLYRHQNAGLNHIRIKVGNNSFVKVKKFRCLGTTQTNLNSVHEEVESTLNFGSGCNQKMW